MRRGLALAALLCACSSWSAPERPPVDADIAVPAVPIFIVVSQSAGPAGRAEAWGAALELAYALHRADIPATVVPDASQLRPQAVAIQGYEPDRACLESDELGIPTSVPALFTLGVYPSRYCVRFGYAFELRRGERVERVDTRTQVDNAAGWLAPVLNALLDRTAELDRDALRRSERQRLRAALAAALVDERELER